MTFREKLLELRPGKADASCPKGTPPKRPPPGNRPTVPALDRLVNEAGAGRTAPALHRDARWRRAPGMPSP